MVGGTLKEILIYDGRSLGYRLLGCDEMRQTMYMEVCNPVVVAWRRQIFKEPAQ